MTAVDITLNMGILLTNAAYVLESFSKHLHLYTLQGRRASEYNFQKINFAAFSIKGIQLNLFKIS